jgi:hypothetical protein
MESPKRLRAPGPVAFTGITVALGPECFAVSPADPRFNPDFVDEGLAEVLAHEERHPVSVQQIISQVQGDLLLVTLVDTAGRRLIDAEGRVTSKSAISSEALSQTLMLQAMNPKSLLRSRNLGTPLLEAPATQPNPASSPVVADATSLNERDIAAFALCNMVKDSKRLVEQMSQEIKILRQALTQEPHTIPAVELRSTSIFFPSHSPPPSSPLPDSLKIQGTHELDASSMVELHSLKVAPEHNGQKGKLVEYSASDGRWSVEMPDGGVLALKPVNLRLLREQNTAITNLEGADTDTDTDTDTLMSRASCVFEVSKGVEQASRKGEKKRRGKELAGSVGKAEASMEGSPRPSDWSEDDLAMSVQDVQHMSPQQLELFHRIRHGTGWQREGDVRTSGQPLQDTREFRGPESNEVLGQGTREFRVQETRARRGPWLTLIPRREVAGSSFEFCGQETSEFRGQETREFRGQVRAGVSPGLASISNVSPCPPPLLVFRISLFRL